ncbi:MAG: homocysteine S-methyltransferase family protein [Myxococcus sp.]|nr:homocysteine S-methyltransferase family protein [Myxococcus sp.]
MTNPFLERLQQGPIISDGAMGTLLHSSGVPHDSVFDVLNLSNPDLVASIHRAYIAAGAEIIETNSYGANRFKLEHLGLAGKVRQLNRVAAKIAREQREVSGRSVFIAGSVGPTLQRLPPIGTANAENVRGVFREQIEALLEGGVDLLSIETIPDIAEMREALAAARECSDLPIIAMLTFAEDGRTVAGNEPAAVVEMLLEHRVDVIGANCSVGPQRLHSRPPEPHALEELSCAQVSSRVQQPEHVVGPQRFIVGAEHAHAHRSATIENQRNMRPPGRRRAAKRQVSPKSTPGSGSHEPGRVTTPGGEDRGAVGPRSSPASRGPAAP